ncbi:hypothetical protein BDV95DRAFT_599465 [Massariosphaeria phaeospora]|uniref:F-box domain-containing protein n=1 Tax=Massariosphaeria phaeospora TaxID=100035 RepID=A0A7C8HZ38_9PLEO|nr:hypothetical protein BDV95DRAFT_599465 [Massariosphaeria phaeospora]
MAATPPSDDLPVNASDLDQEIAGFTGYTIDLNYSRLEIYPQGEYPDDTWSRLAGCFHSFQSEIVRREDYRTLEEYWEFPGDRFSSGSIAYDGCYAPITYHFRICRSSPRGFTPFFELSNENLYDLRTLTVRLDPELPAVIKLGGDWTRLAELAPLNLRSRNGKSAMEDWETLIRRLAQCIRPNYLTLFLIVKTLDIETAEAVLKPLKLLPTLNGCGIWLNKKAIVELNDLIRNTVGHVTTPSGGGPQSFRYLDLPLELRYRILEHSDLISMVDLEWKPPSSSVAIATRQCDCDYVDLFGHLGDCTRMAKLSKPINPEDHFARHCPHGCHMLGEMEFCKRLQSGSCVCLYHCKHSAYSSTMAAPKTGVHPLFLVSRQVRQDAIPVFYQRNRFVVTPCGIVPLRDATFEPSRLHIFEITSPLKSVELSLFLSSLPRNALQHIRYLEWMLPQLGSFRHASKRVYLDYLDTIEMMAHAIPLSQLTLVLNLRVMHHYNILENHSFRWPTRSAHTGAIYDAVLNPLGRLHGLKDCFVYLRRIVKKGSGHDWPNNCAFDNDEMRYEKAIMGPEYDSRKRGKPWKERVEQNLYHLHQDDCKVDTYEDYWSRQD